MRVEKPDTPFLRGGSGFSFSKPLSLSLCVFAPAFRGRFSHRPRPLKRRPSDLAKHAALVLGSHASGEGRLHGKNADRAWQGLALGCCRSDSVGLRLRLVDQGIWQMEKSGMLSFSNALEVFAVLVPGILLLIVGRRLRARHEKFIRNFAESAAQRAGIDLEPRPVSKPLSTTRCSSIACSSWCSNQESVVIVFIVLSCF